MSQPDDGQIVDFRWTKGGLEYRARKFVIDNWGDVRRLGDWSDWRAVPSAASPTPSVPMGESKLYLDRTAVRSKLVDVADEDARTATLFLARIDQLPPLTAADIYGALPLDVRRLVIAARRVAFESQDREALKELDNASEAFAARVPWEDELAPHLPAKE